MEIHLLMQIIEVLMVMPRVPEGTSKSKKAILVIWVMVEAHNPQISLPI